MQHKHIRKISLVDNIGSPSETMRYQNKICSTQADIIEEQYAMPGNKDCFFQSKPLISIPRLKTPHQENNFKLTIHSAVNTPSKCMSIDFARNPKILNNDPATKNAGGINRRQQQTLASLTNVDLSSSLYILENCIMGCSQAKKILGWSDFSLNYFRISQNGFITFNFSTIAKSKNRLTNQCIITKNIVDTIRGISDNKFMDFYAYYQRNLSRENIDFKYMQSLIKSYSLCAKIKINNKISEEVLMGKKQQKYITKTVGKEDKIQIKQILKNGEEIKSPRSQNKNSRPHSLNYPQFKCKTNKNSTNNKYKSFKVGESPSSAKNQASRVSQRQINNQFSLSIGPSFLSNFQKGSLTSTYTKDSKDDKQEKQKNLTSSNNKVHKIDNILNVITLNKNYDSGQKQIFREVTNEKLNPVKNLFGEKSPKDNYNREKQQKFETKDLIFIKSSKQEINLFGENVNQVESQGTFSEADISQYSSKNSETTNEELARLKIKQNQQHIYQQNSWTKGISNLFSIQAQLQQSLVVNSAKQHKNRANMAYNVTRFSPFTARVESSQKENNKNYE